MKKIVFIVLAIGVLGAFVFVATRGGKTETRAEVTLYKSTSCGCCDNYVSYLKRKGFKATVALREDMEPIKQQYGIPTSLWSCHTAVVGGYVVEGHVPTEAIEKLLERKDDIAGIALPDMPQGSPGMPGSKIEPFRIHAITHDGNDGGLFFEL